MNALILNRDSKLPADGWHQIEVPGEHVNHDAAVVQVIDAKAIEAILNRFKVEAAAPNFAGMLVDQDHFSLDPDQPSEAMGWALELRNRDGIPEARIDWTAAGRPKIEGKDYKFFSTVYDPEECEPLGQRIINGKSYQVVRPLHLCRLALTNDPNNKGGRPISNRDANPGDAGKTKPVPTMKRLLKLLGLADDASEDSAVAAVQTIQNRATTAEGQVTTLTKERDTLAAAQVEADLEKYKNRFKPENRDAVKAQLLANRAGTLAILEVAAEVAPVSAKKPITNRATAATPDAGKDEQTTDAVRQQEELVNSIRIKNRCSFRDAWDQARREKPELFAAEAK